MAVYQESNILVTSVSKKIPLIRSLRKASLMFGNKVKIFGADSNNNCIGKYFVDEFWNMPLLDQMNIEYLIDYCKNHGISYIVPSRDGELLYFSKFKSKLKHHNIHVMVSDYDTIKTCLDKLTFSERLYANGFPVVMTVEDIGCLESDYYVVKERFGAGSRSIGLKLSRKESIEHAEQLKNPIYQPFIFGKEYSVDLYVDKTSKTKGIVVRERELVVNGESQITVTLRNDKLEKLCGKLAESIGICGHAVLQVLIDDYGMFHIVECNSRFGGASSLSFEVGLHSFYWFLLESVGKNINDYPFIRSKREKRQVRYAEDMFISE
ncbi:carbamoyl-phosphate synthase large subunit [Methanolobus vulcani]|jgi:Carbamoylphosphate synthase large subunit (split gene in MJ)|uniref:Carbamoyl-phosphate synthase large subunit n=1 Tax=Methanolobus vulcani TaxID=38026 RepID=A0A7Z7B0S8_9EURY|nr:ATP-grasp domain-containing protein [Methanolobus vulcani]SDF57702.1 carbamoyl-phosphate synthase large subunit [Methanolobus vulcani]